MKGLMLGLTMVLALVSCAKAPPTLTPAGAANFQKLQVVKTLNLLQDTAIAANKTTPPLLTDETTRKVVTTHRSSLVVINASAAGWQNAVMAILDEVPKNLPAREAGIIAPYLALAKTALTEALK